MIAPTAPGRPALPDFDVAPFIVIWEMTQACDLACLHCRASAQPRRRPDELTTDEAKRLMDEVRAMGNPLFVLTGGDPLKRPDTVEIVEYGARIGLRVAMTPSGTPLLTPTVLAELRDAGLARLAVSLDGSNATVHDRFRGVDGSFDASVRMLRVARELGLSTQINTTIHRGNVDDLESLSALAAALGIALWSLFVVVPTGRAHRGQLPTAEEMEDVFARVAGWADHLPFDVKTTAAPHYRRVALQRDRDARREARRAGMAYVEPSRWPVGVAPTGAEIGRIRGVTDGNGFVFVSHTGEIFPSGFLPLRAGNVRTDDLATVYRESPLFRALRDRDAFAGKCGACEFRWVCGGSRARAYAMTGSATGSDPLCAYLPPSYDAAAATSNEIER